MAKQQSFRYKVVEPNADYRKAVIRKSGYYSETLTLEECEKQRLKWSAEKREFEGQLKVEEAKAANITEHHPFVTEMSEQDQYTVWMYYEAMRKAGKLKEFIQQRVDALDVYIKEEQHIIDVLGLAKKKKS